MTGFKDEDFSLSGLTQQGHELDVTVISSDDEEDNYGWFIRMCLTAFGEISEKTTTSVEGGIK